MKQVFDFIRCSEDKNKLLNLVENNVYYKEMDEDAFDVVTKYTNSKELVKAKDYTVDGGKKDVCKAIRDLMDDSREEGKELGLEKGRELGLRTASIENAKNLFKNDTAYTMVRASISHLSDKELKSIYKEVTGKEIEE